MDHNELFSAISVVIIFISLRQHLPLSIVQNSHYLVNHLLSPLGSEIMDEWYHM